MTKEISFAKRTKIFKRDGGKCQMCGTILHLNKERLDSLYAQLDHIIPKSLGGNNTYENLRLICGNCNNRRSNKLGEVLFKIMSNNIENLNLIKYEEKLKESIKLGLTSKDDVLKLLEQLCFSYKENRDMLLKIIKED